MNDNNAIPLNLTALHSESFLNYLSLKDMGRLRQVNQELYKSSLLKNKMLMEGMRWVQNANNPVEMRKTVLSLLFAHALKKSYNPKFYSFYLFLGGNVPFDLIKTKAKQERRRDKWRENAITTFSCTPKCLCMGGDRTCQRCTSLTFLTLSAILCLGLPACNPTPCVWLTYTGAATLGTTVGGTTVACLEKKFHIFTFCCEPYNQLEKLDKADRDNQAPARIEMVDDEPAIPIQAAIPDQRNSLSNCFRRLFFKPARIPNESTPLVSENNSCASHPGYAKK